MPFDQPPLLAPPGVVRYCGTCGEPQDTQSGPCQNCSVRGDPRAEAERAATEVRRDARRVKSALVLYFALLGVSVVQLIALIARGQDAPSVRVMLVADAVM